MTMYVQTVASVLRQTVVGAPVIKRLVTSLAPTKPMADYCCLIATEPNDRLQPARSFMTSTTRTHVNDVGNRQTALMTSRTKTPLCMITKKETCSVVINVKRFYNDSTERVNTKKSNIAFKADPESSHFRRSNDKQLTMFAPMDSAVITTSLLDTTITSPAAVSSDVTTASSVPESTYVMPHPIWSDDELHSIEITHQQPENGVDRAALFCVKSLRSFFDCISGYKWRVRTEQLWLTRIIFLETVAAVPGMLGALSRHLLSLRKMRRDYAWIHTLLEEAENEKMHLLTALQMKNPGRLFRLSVTVAQGAFVPAFGLAYIISPRFCHRFVGYLEEEAVRTYTKCLQDIESGSMQHWKTQAAPSVAVNYWKLTPDATMRDVILAIRADEAHHRVVNHTFSSMKTTELNPYGPGR